MPVETPRPAEGATVALALEASPADLTDALLEVRAALLAEIGRHQNAQGPANTPTGRAPRNICNQDNTDADFSRAAG